MNRRLLIQGISFGVSVFLLSGLFYRLTFLAVSVSPLIGLANLINGYPLTWNLLLGIPVILLGLFKGRYFCHFICPTGTLLERAPFGRRKKIHSTPLPMVLLIVVLGTSFFTLMAVSVLDPLVIFAGAVNVFQDSATYLDLWLVLPLLVLLLLNLLGRRYWCYRLCPLGALLQLLAQWRFTLSSGGKRSHLHKGVSRRAFVSALTGGLVLGWLGIRRGRARSRRLIRPPGALPGELLNRQCVRCGNCMKACITNGILPCLLDAGAEGIFTPRLVPSIGYCDEYCVACTWSCPTGALRPLSLAEKREERLGLARVAKERCLAWADNKFCLVCQEYCSYNAIDIRRKENGIPCPVVNSARCRGCGQCEFQCKTKKTAAIQVYALE